MAIGSGTWGSRFPYGTRNLWGFLPAGVQPPGPIVPVQFCYDTYKSQQMIATLPKLYQKAASSDSFLRQLMCAIGTEDNSIGGEK